MNKDTIEVRIVEYIAPSESPLAEEHKSTWVDKSWTDDTNVEVGRIFGRYLQHISGKYDEDMAQEIVLEMLCYLSVQENDEGWLSILKTAGEIRDTRNRDLGRD
jgi:hypothetical protein